MSEIENSYNGLIKWLVNSNDVEKLLIIHGKQLKNICFSIGSPSFCSFNFVLSYGGCSGLFIHIDFKEIPENAWIEGELTINELKMVTFSFSGKEAEKQIKVAHFHWYRLPNNFDKNINNWVLKCFMKIKLKEITCSLDKHTVQHAEIRSYDLYQNILSKLDYLSNVTISIQKDRIKSHKAVLAKVPFFSELFMKDESKDYFELEDISLNLFQDLLNYLYTGSVPEMNFRKACEIYVLAYDLQVFDLKNMCSSYLGASLTEGTVFIVFSLSVECEDMCLKRECIGFLKKSSLEQLAEASVVY